MREPVEVMAQQVARHCPPHSAHGPAAFKTAEAQLDALDEAGYVIVPRFDLVSLWGFLGTVVKHLPLIVPRQRAHQWRKTVRGWLDIENDGAGD